MSLYDGTQTVPVPYEVVQSIVSIIRADAGVVNTQAIEQTTHVFEHFVTDPRPKRLVCVRVADEPTGIQTISGARIVPILIEASIHTDMVNFHQFLDEIHKAIFQAVVNQKPTLTKNQLVLPYYRQTPAGSPSYDDQRGEWYSAALYYAVVQPI